ncbi:MAG: N-acyl homoserine lactonase family protein [Luteimonas sp.]
MKTDNQLQHVIAELELEPLIHDACIGPEVEDALVTQAERAGSYPEKWNGEHATQRVSGMRAMTTELKNRTDRLIGDVARHLPGLGARTRFTLAFLTLFVFGATTPVLAQQTTSKSSPPAVMRLYTLDCGLTEFSDADIFSDTGEYAGKPLALPAPCYLIRHGKEWMVWDTGLSDKLAAMPNGLVTMGGRFTAKRTLAAQLTELGLKPDDVRYVGLSHLHLDHTGNIDLFPKSIFLVSSLELAWARGNPTPFGVDTASIGPLAYSDVHATADDQDVFGDGTVKILKTPGHTPGHRSLLIKLANSGVVLITGDLYHTRQNYEKGLVPHGNNRADTLASMNRFAKIQSNTNARVVIEHSPEDFAGMPAFPKYLD